MDHQFVKRILSSNLHRCVYRFYFMDRTRTRLKKRKTSCSYTWDNVYLVRIYQTSSNVLLIICPLNELTLRVTQREISLSEVWSSITRLGAYRASLSVDSRSKQTFVQFGLLMELEKVNSTTVRSDVPREE